MSANQCYQKKNFFGNLLGKISCYLLLAGTLLVGFYSCASKADKEPVALEENEQEQLKNLDEKAKGAIARAESANAAEFSPEYLEEAYFALNNGQNPDLDEGTIRKHYLSAIDNANLAYEESITRAQEYWLNTIQNYERSLNELNGPLYMPEYDTRSRMLLNQLGETITQGLIDESLVLYQSVIPNVDAVVLALAANIDWLDQLRQEVTGLLGEASRINLAGNAMELERQGQAAYESSMANRSRGDMQAMEQDLFDARYFLSESLRYSGTLEPSAIDKLMRRVQKSLEAASMRQAVDLNGTELEIPPWNGDIYLQQHPLADLSESQQAGEVRRDETRLLEPDVSADFYNIEGRWADDPVGKTVTGVDDLLSFQIDASPLDPAEFQSQWDLSLFSQQVEEQDYPNEQDFVIQADEQYIADDAPSPETTALLNDGQLLLQQAIKTWQNGVGARNSGNLAKARHYFEESERLIDQYNVQYAIMGYYTVRKMKPEDCLWRIAGYSDIYGDPFQWTRIYQRNRDIISNPSLIYPGQRFIIPPALEVEESETEE